MSGDGITWGDNVIYADFGSRRRGGKKGGRTGGLKGARPRTPLARRLYDAVADSADAARRSRGEAYYRDGHVLGHRMVDGQIVGEVKGSQLEPFTVVIRLPGRDGAADRFLRWLAGTSGAAEDFDHGILPADRIGELLLDADENVTARCSCPDPSAVCKHAVAVAAAAGAELDADPMSALELRGVSVHEARHRLAKLVSEAAQAVLSPARPVRRPTGPKASDPVLEEVERDFWGADLADVDLPAPAPLHPLRDTDPTLLHAALRPATVISHETLRAVADLEDCWDHLMAPPGVVAASFDDDDD